MEYIRYLRQVLWGSPQSPDSFASLECQTPVTSIPRRRSSPKPRHIDRCIILDDIIILRGYPSRGGLVVLESADSVDFYFLEISRFDPPMIRAATPEAEDEFCQRLLMLGAKWFDSRSRYRFMCGLREGDHRCMYDLEHWKKPELILGERQWIKVGWPSQPAGGLWVGEWDTNLPGILEEDEIVPTDVARVTLATNMDERCEILKGLGAKFYKNLDEYSGHGYLKAWQTKWQGEVAPLEQTWVKA